MAEIIKLPERDLGQAADCYAEQLRAWVDAKSWLPKREPERKQSGTVMIPLFRPDRSA